MDNKNVFANNLKKQMELKDVSRKDLSETLGISYFTITAWVNGTKYPRMDKVEMLANYFGIQKSDLIEDKTAEEKEIPGEITLTEDERKFIELIRQIPEQDRPMVWAMIQAAVNTQLQP